MKSVFRLVLLALLCVPASAGAKWINDKVQFETTNAGKVTFSHYNHLEAVGKNCPSCHNDTFHIVRAKNKRHTMAEMEGGKSCGHCHNGEKAFSVKGDCSTCHPTKDIVFQIPAAGKVIFSHDVHTGMFSCGECHPGTWVPGGKNPTVTMKQMEKGKSCGMCHDGSTAFSVASDCSSCHPTRDITFKVSDGDAKFSHEIHTGMYSCSECHDGIFIPGPGNTRYGMDQMMEGNSCGACHDGSTAFSVDDNCSNCHPSM